MGHTAVVTDALRRPPNTSARHSAQLDSDGVLASLGRAAGPVFAFAGRVVGCPRCSTRSPSPRLLAAVLDRQRAVKGPAAGCWLMPREHEPDE